MSRSSSVKTRFESPVFAGGKGPHMHKRITTLIAAMAVVITAGALWLTNRAAVPVQATWDDVLAEAKAGGYKIITTEELAGKYHSNPGGLFLVDTRQEWEYRTGHLKGAANFPIEPTAWSRRRRAQALATLLGPDKSRTIIFY